MRARWLLAQTDAQRNACYQLRTYAFDRSTLQRPHQDRFDVQTLPDGSPQSYTFEIKRYGMTVGTARLTIAAHPEFTQVHSEVAELVDTAGDLAGFVNARTVHRDGSPPVVAEIGCVGISAGANRDGAVLREINRAIASVVTDRSIDVLLWLTTPQAVSHINAQGMCFDPVPGATFNRRSPHILRYMAHHYDVFLPDLDKRLPELAFATDIIDDMSDEMLREMTSGCADGAYVYWMDAHSFASAARSEVVTALG